MLQHPPGDSGHNMLLLLLLLLLDNPPGDSGHNNMQAVTKALGAL
jgi:hypothetical protein